MKILDFLKIEGAEWDAAKENDAVNKANSSRPGTGKSVAWEGTLLLLMFVVCWVVRNFVRDRLAMLVCNGILFLAIAVYPFYRRIKSDDTLLLITEMDIARIFLFVLMGLRLQFTAVPWFGGLFWVVALIAPLVVLCSGATVNKGRFFLNREGTTFVAVYLALNLWNDLWIYSNYAKGMTADIREQTISLPVSAALASDKKYKAIALFRVKSMSNTGGVGGCIERLLFDGSHGPAIQKDCCDVLAASEMGEKFSEEGCYSEEDRDWENPWTIKPIIKFPGLVSFLYHLKSAVPSNEEQ